MPKQFLNPFESLKTIVPKLYLENFTEEFKPDFSSISKYYGKIINYDDWQVSKSKISKRNKRNMN